MAAALGGRFKRFSCFHPRWPDIGDSGKSLLSVFVIAVSNTYIHMVDELVHHVAPVHKEAAKNRLRSRGYPFPAFEDRELFLFL